MRFSRKPNVYDKREKKKTKFYDQTFAVSWKIYTPNATHPSLHNCMARLGELVWPVCHVKIWSRLGTTCWVILNLKLIAEEQHGFVKNKSCYTNLLETLDDV